MSAEDYIRHRLAAGDLTHSQVADLARAFQHQNGLLVDGKPGPVTLGCVDEILSELRNPPPVDAETPLGLPNLEMNPRGWLFGIDLDHHQRFLSMHGLLEDDPRVSFAFVGLTEGTSGRASIDPMYRGHIERLHAARVPLGVYHFGRPSSAKRFGSRFGQPLGEAENFARYHEVAHRMSGGKLLPPVLDMEDERETLTPVELIDWTLKWCEECKRLTGRQPIIYTYFSFIHLELKGYSDDLTKHQLWVADYREVPPNLPREIPEWPWLLWQYTGAGSVRSISGHVDQNVFRGTRAQLEGMLA